MAGKNKNQEILDLYIASVPAPDTEAARAARERLDSLVKPVGSLGELENIAEKLAGMTGKIYNSIDKRCVVVMAADNGVVEEGVASAPKSVTHMQTLNFLRGITGVSVLAKQSNADLIVVDIGVDADIDDRGILNRKIRKSTSNIAKEPAMTRDEAVRAILAGIEVAMDAAKNGYKIIGVGEMGIGNTTTSSAVLCALTGIDVSAAAGKGAGLSDEAYEKKLGIIETALRVNNPGSDPVDILAGVGGFDIAAMTGVYIGAAVSRVPAVIDGFISMVAALAAARLNPKVRDFMFASHISYEQGYAHAAKALGIRGTLDFGMRLGEGSGCPIMFSVIDSALAVIRDMGTFGEANIDDEYCENVKGAEKFEIRGKA